MIFKSSRPCNFIIVVVKDHFLFLTCKETKFSFLTAMFFLINTVSQNNDLLSLV